MRISMHTGDIDVVGAIESYIQRRLHFALGRFGSRVGQVSVRIGAHGRSNVSCDIIAEVLPWRRVTVQESDADLFSAIDRATGRIGRLFGRELERARDIRTGRESVRVPAA
jgi:putative sigma-54 modulation protein